MFVEDQVMVIFAVTRGYLDDIEVDEIQRWGWEFLEFMRSKPEVGGRLRDEKVLSEDLEAQLVEAIEGFKKIFGGPRGVPEAEAEPAAAG
jgi:F-type H+-transporting ATPase subunit alpha